MPIDVEAALGYTFPESRFSWDEDDVILYHLGVGAGSDPTDPAELRYVYEGDLHVLPTYGTIPPFETMMSLGTVEGLEINLAQILHGEQELVVHGPIPTSGSVVQAGKVAAIYDKRSGAVIVLEVVSTLEKTGEPLFTNRASIFVRGEGGFGGESGPSTRIPPPDREPDRVVESPTLPQQALIYRLASGDKNPLHADPAFAAFAGFERPILHGLCTYGILAKAVVDHALDGDPGRVASYRARFSGHFFPGETLVTSMWEEDGRIVVRGECAERETTVVSDAEMTLW